LKALLLHGFTGSPQSFDAVGLPAASFAPCLAGHLDTPAIGDFNAEVERLATLAEGCSTLVGYSLGGRFALALLARYPERFERALIVSAQPGLQSDSERSRRREGDARLVAILREQGLAAFVDHWQALPLWASQGQLPAGVRQEQRRQRLRHHPEGLAQSLLRHGLAEMPDLRPHLRHVRSRVDLLVGERDEKFVAFGRELLTLLPSARLTVAEGAGHNLLLERPELVRKLSSPPSPA
jgi:2-succinyl-6-hydroxy-2,4-cyclohexadiene-1-carboxylate synthase